MSDPIQNKQGYFITFEGPDGGGKTTQIRLLAEALQAQNHRVLLTREPGGTTIGGSIRSLLLDPAHTDMNPRAEALLFNAARAQLVHQAIRPALAEGQIILCDRFADSTLAYQGYGYTTDPIEQAQRLTALRQIIDFATDSLRPNLTIYLDIDPEQGIQRKLSDTEGEWNRLDAQALQFHQAVHHGYQQLIKADPERWFVVDATQTVETIHEIIWTRVLNTIQ
ncbi:MAG: dTMP kinase [Chloroflexota bacterium]